MISVRALNGVVTQEDVLGAAEYAGGRRVLLTHRKVTPWLPSLGPIDQAYTLLPGHTRWTTIFSPPAKWEAALKAGKVGETVKASGRVMTFIEFNETEITISIGLDGAW